MKKREIYEIKDNLGQINEQITEIEIRVTNIEQNSGGEGKAYRLNNKKWLAIGDSITASTFHSEKNYHDFIKENTNCFVQNYGKDGFTYVQMISEISKMPLATEVDIVTVFLGTNDWHIGNIPLGTFLDSGTVTVGGVVHEFFNSLLWKYNEKSIVVFSPLPRYNGTQYGYNCSNNDRGYNLLDLVELIKKTCEHYSIPFYDLYRNSGFQLGFTTCRNKYFTDGLHPNIIGHQALGNIMLNFIESNFKNYNEDNIDISVIGISLNKSTSTIISGQSEQLIATLTPSNATNKNITWSSSNIAVVTVSSDGIITGVGVGSSIVTVTTQDGNKTATCDYTISTQTEIDINYLESFGTEYVKIIENSSYYSYNSDTKQLTQIKADGRAATSLPIVILKPNTNYRLNCTDNSQYMNLSAFTGGSWKTSDRGDMYFQTGTSGKCRIHFMHPINASYIATLTHESWGGKTTILTD